MEDNIIHIDTERIREGERINGRSATLKKQ